MPLGEAPRDWDRPTRYFVMEKVPLSYSGWYPETLYKKTYSILRDLAYTVYEVRYLHVPPKDKNGEQAIIAWLRGGKEVDFLYTLNNIWVKLTIAWSQKPRPGSDPKNPVMGTYGTARFEIDSFVRTDYKTLWTESPLLRFLRPFREKYLYMDKIDLFAAMCRKDVDITMKKLQEYIDYLPTISQP